MWGTNIHSVSRGDRTRDSHMRAGPGQWTPLSLWEAGRQKVLPVGPAVTQGPWDPQHSQLSAEEPPKTITEQRKEVTREGPAAGAINKKIGTGELKRMEQPERDKDGHI